MTQMLHDAGQHGVTQLRTRRQRRIRTAAFLVAVLGLIVCVAAGSVIVALIRDGRITLPHLVFRPLREAGAGPIIDVAGNNSSSSRKGWQFPAALTMPAGWVASCAVGVALWIGWFRLLVAPLLRRTRRETRQETGFAAIGKIRERYGARAVRKTGAFTLPGTNRLQRWLLPMTSFGYEIGRPRTPRARLRLWTDWEQRVRIIARQGWGKTLRLLVPIIRRLPGPAVVSSIEPEIFAMTVRARQFRVRPTRMPLSRVLPAYRRVQQYPVFVVDFSAVHTRMAAGFPQIRWNPIPGCEDWTTAGNRARALVHAGDRDSGVDNSTDKFFRDSATAVLASWLHAAALSGGTEISEFYEWLRDSDIDTPRSLLEGAGQWAAPAAILGLAKHLDPKAGKTTSGVERYITFALNSLISAEGQQICGSAKDPSFSFERLIEREGTLYLLTEPDRAEVARPLLSLIAQEMFLAAERVARRQPGRTKRLPRTFMGVLDELQYGVRLANLPYVAGALRKMGISYITACLSAVQEIELYGENDAQKLRALANTTIVGGYDEASADVVSRRAGQTAVVRASRNLGTDGGVGSEQVQMLDVLTEADQNEIEDGVMTVLGRGVRPFLGYAELIYERSRRYRRRVLGEADEVNATVSEARRELIAQHEYQQQLRIHSTVIPMTKRTDRRSASRRSAS